MEKKFRFSGVEKVCGSEPFNKVKKSHVLIIGLGGVGSWVAEGLARSGVGEITLVDPDSVCETNINRQLLAVDSTVGQPKVKALGDRLRDINPEIKIHTFEDFFCDDTAPQIFNTRYDYAFDGIDRLKNKLLFIDCCRDKEIPFLISGGAGGKFDATQIQVSDLGMSYRDKLLFRVRKKLKQQGKVKKGRKKTGIMCVFSPEETLYPTPEGTVSTSKQGLEIKKLDCHGSIGSFAPVTGTFGLMASGHIIKELIK